MLNRRDVVQRAAVMAAATMLPARLDGARLRPLSDDELEALVRANARKAHAGLVVTGDVALMREGVAFFEERGNAPVYVAESVERAKAIVRERAAEIQVMLTEGDDWKTVWLPFAREDMARFGHIGLIRFDEAPVPPPRRDGRVWAIYDNPVCRDTIRRLHGRGASGQLVEVDLAEYGFALGDVRPGDSFWLALERYDDERRFAALLLRLFPGAGLCRSGLNL